MPKYPRPQARVETMLKNPKDPAVPVDATYPWVTLRYPGSARALLMTALIPPA